MRIRRRSLLPLLGLSVTLLGASGSCKLCRGPETATLAELEAQREAEREAEKKKKAALADGGSVEPDAPKEVLTRRGDKVPAFEAKDLPDDPKKAYAFAVEEFRKARLSPDGGLASPSAFLSPMPDPFAYKRLVAVSERFEGSPEAAKIADYVAYKTAFETFFQDGNAGAFRREVHRILEKNPQSDFADEMLLGLRLGTLMSIRPELREGMPEKTSFELLLQTLELMLPGEIEPPDPKIGDELQNETVSRLCLAMLGDRCDGIAALAGMKLSAERLMSQVFISIGRIARRSGREDTKRLVTLMMRGPLAKGDIQSRVSIDLDRGPLLVNGDAEMGPEHLLPWAHRDRLYYYGNFGRLGNTLIKDFGKITNLRVMGQELIRGVGNQILSSYEKTPEGLRIKDKNARNNGKLILIKDPYEGARWDVPGGTRRVRATNVDWEGPIGLLKGCAEVIEERNFGGFLDRELDIFCPGIGLALHREERFGAPQQLLRKEFFVIGYREGKGEGAKVVGVVPDEEL